MGSINLIDLRTDGTPLATGIPPSVIWFIFLAILSTWILTKTRYGNWIFASGGDKNGATNVGVPVGRVKIGLFISTAVASTIGISKEIIKKGLKEFKGVQRRFNKIFTYQGVNFYDDYAHHPTEIKEVLNGVRAAYKKKEVICIFQPHRISRLKDLKSEFSHSFKKADTVILCPVYTAGEKIKLGFNYNNFAKSIIKNSNVNLFMVNDQYQLAKFVKNNIYGKKIVIGMGAGTISGWIKELPKLI